MTNASSREAAKPIRAIVARTRVGELRAASGGRRARRKARDVGR